MQNRALFTFWDGGDGHLTRISAIAKVLHEAGFELGFISATSHAEKVRKLNVAVVIYKIENRKRRIPPPPYDIPIFSHAYSHSQRLLGLGFGDTDFLQQTVEAELDAIRSFKPQIVLNDYRDTIHISAQAARLPVIGVTMTNGNTAGYSMGWWVQRPPNLVVPNCLPSFNTVRAIYGLPLLTDERQAFEGVINLIPSSGLIDPFRVQRSHNVYVGVLDQLSPELTKPADIPAGKPLVFCNLGEDNNSSRWRFDPILCELTTLVDAMFVVTGPMVKYPETYSFASSSNNLLIKERWSDSDYAWIMSNASVAITHGGTSALVGLRSGIPQIFIPRNTEPTSAYTVGTYGAGLNVPHSTLPLERRFAPDLGPAVEIMGHWDSQLNAVLLAQYLRLILSKGTYKQRARELERDLNRFDARSEILKAVASLIP